MDEEDAMSKPLAEKHTRFVPLIAAIDRMESELQEGRPVLVHAEAGAVHETL